MRYICPLVVVEDVQKARFLYEEILGQSVKADFGENVTFHGDFAIHQKSHFRDLINEAPVTQKSHSFELCFEEDDLITIVEKLQAHQFEFVHEIVEQPWRQQVVRFYDYDKNMIEIGERMEHVAYRLSQEGKTTEEISKITFLPAEMVLEAVEEYSA